MELALFILAAAVAVLAALVVLILVRLNKPAELPPELIARLTVIEKAAAELPGAVREEGRLSRDDLRAGLTSAAQLQETRLGEFGKAQAEQLSAMRSEATEGRNSLEQAVQRNAEGFATSQAERLKETNDFVRSLADRLLAAQDKGREEQKAALEGVTATIAKLVEANDRKQDVLRETISGGLEKMRTDNAEKLEKMRETVDEKLQGTLEKRLGESFQLVSERLELVHKGLGEMQNLATGVGDLKRVLTNVKSRGGWGEVQLGMLLEDMLTRDQYASNVRIRPDSNEIVEFAVRLPGRGDDQPVWLPIDAKFPHEDYDRLLLAQEGGNADEVERAALALERAIKVQAKRICEKYIHAPHSTDFAIMYLPTEGLFAEVIRRPGLAAELQTNHRVTVQGPTTLAALLSSLQMGFRTLAIEKRSSEVWQVLSAAKAEFVKYGDVWEKLGRQLDTAKRTVDEAGKRTRAVTRKLRDVETIDISDAPALLGLVADEALDEEEEQAQGEA